MAPYKIQRKADKYRAVLWLPQHNTTSQWFAARIDALRWAFETVARLDAINKETGQ